MPPGPEVQSTKAPTRLSRALDHVLQDSGLRRNVFLTATGVSVTVITLITVLFTVLALTSSAGTADRLAAAGDVLVGATLLLAAIAALVALVAYAVSTGAPNLQLRVQFDSGFPNNLVFEAETQDSGALKLRFTRSLGKVLLRNDSGYSAKNPAVIVRLHAMVFRAADPNSFERDWASMEIADTFPLTKLRNTLTIVQWDGGPMYSIHGHSTRRLPDLQFSDLWSIPGLEKPVLTFEILADGYRKEIPLQVDFIVDGKSQFPREDGKLNPEWM